jgi:hypothetical protein
LFPGASDLDATLAALDARAIYAQKGRPGGQEIYAVIRDGWKHIWRIGSYRVLYDVANDPFEETSTFRADEEPGASLHAELVAYRAAAQKAESESVVVPLDADRLEHLRALGYVETLSPDPAIRSAPP